MFSQQSAWGSRRPSLLCCANAPPCRSCRWHTAHRLRGLAGLPTVADCQASALCCLSWRRSIPKLLSPSGNNRPGMPCVVNGGRLTVRQVYTGNCGSLRRRENQVVDLPVGLVCADHQFALWGCAQGKSSWKSNHSAPGHP